MYLHVGCGVWDACTLWVQGVFVTWDVGCLYIGGTGCTCYVGVWSACILVVQNELVIWGCGNLYIGGTGCSFYVAVLGAVVMWGCGVLVLYVWGGGDSLSVVACGGVGCLYIGSTGCSCMGGCGVLVWGGGEFGDLGVIVLIIAYVGVWGACTLGVRDVLVIFGCGGLVHWGYGVYLLCGGVGCLYIGGTGVLVMWVWGACTLGLRGVVVMWECGVLVHCGYGV